MKDTSAEGHMLDDSVNVQANLQRLRVVGGCLGQVVGTVTINGHKESFLLLGGKKNALILKKKSQLNITVYFFSPGERAECGTTR